MRIGSVEIPIEKVTSRSFIEQWYNVNTDGNKNTNTKEQPALRIKCKFQVIDILPIEMYSEFLEVRNLFIILLNQTEFNLLYIIFIVLIVLTFFFIFKI